MGLGGKKGGKKTHAVEPRFKELFIKFSQQPSRASRVRPSCFSTDVQNWHTEPAPFALRNEQKRVIYNSDL